MKEHDVIEKFRSAFAGSGIGDDAAILMPPDGDLLFASDAVVEGVHFRRGYATLSQAVQKVITSNVSDIFAMGGEPHAIVMTAGLPEGCGEAEIDEIIGGAALACGMYKVRFSGGDTVRSPGGYFFDVAITGSVARGRAVRRSGARPGDALVLFGTCGGSLAGMKLLESIFGAIEGGADLGAVMPVDAAAIESVRRAVGRLDCAMTPDDMSRIRDENGIVPAAQPVLELAARHLAPSARPVERSLLDDDRSDPGVPFITAMIDISDGLSRDLRTLCAESGVGAVVKERRLPLHPVLMSVRPADGGGEYDSDPFYIRASLPAKLDLALSSGEEYVMLAAVHGLAEGAEPPGGTVIGRVVDREEGVAIGLSTGDRRPLTDSGYEHSF
jgi:thiamine-monophosphate kinase